MTIIEKEIERREGVIVETGRKKIRVAEMLEEIDRLEAEIANTDLVALQAEIDELKTYLPKPAETDNPTFPFV